MTSPPIRDPIEIYLLRIVSLLASIFSFYWAWTLRSWVWGVFAAAILLGLARKRDYRSKARWVTFLVAYAVCALSSAGALYLTRDGSADLLVPGSAGRWIWLAMTAGSTLNAVVLVSGRIRRVWSFTRPPVSIAVPEAKGHTF